jgi:uroporphyrinogen-III decarboxylase
MNSNERLLTAFRGGTPDRVPVSPWISLRVFEAITGKSPRQFLDEFAEDPGNSVIKIQEDLGLDPILITFQEFEDEVVDWPKRYLRWAPQAFENWKVETEISDREGNNYTVQRTITTPEGKLRSVHRAERYQKCAIEYLIKDETDLELLKYRPDPKYLDVSRLAELVRKVGNRGTVLHNFQGPWCEACTLRGLVAVSMDIYDRPDWLHRYMQTISDYLEQLLARVLESGLEVILFDESWVGAGFSPKVFNEYIFPHDQRLIRLIRNKKVIADYHNCGRVTALLEAMAATGADVLEPLLPPVLNGDIELADAKKRVGKGTALYGAFNERVLSSDDPDDVIREVHRCIDAGAQGGGYAIRGGGQIFDAKLKNIELMSKEVARYGSYK